MKHFISVILYAIVLLTYLLVQDHEIWFIYTSWIVGHFKEMYCPSYWNWTVN